MKHKDFIKLPPEQQEAYWKAAQTAAQEKAARRSNT